jgi:hypothetical protein
VRENEARKARARRARTPARGGRAAVGERQSVDDLVLAHRGNVAYALVVDKPAASRRADVPTYVTGSQLSGAAARPDQRRRRAGKPPSRGHRPGREEPRPTLSLTAPRSIRAPARSCGACRSCPSDGAYAATIVVSADNKHRYVAALGPSPGKTRIVEHLPGQRVGARPRRVRPAADHDGLRARHGRLWFLSERDGWMHLYVADLAAATPRRGSSPAARGRSPTRSSRRTAGSS